MPTSWHMSSKISEKWIWHLYYLFFFRTRLSQWSVQLGSVTDDNFIQEFHQALVQYFHALGGIVPIFTYMNRFYIEAKLHTDLKTELTKLFSSLVADKHVTRLVNLMVSAQSRSEMLKGVNPTFFEYDAKLLCLCLHWYWSLGRVKFWILFPFSEILFSSLI